MEILKEKKNAARAVMLLQQNTRKDVECYKYYVAYKVILQIIFKRQVKARLECYDGQEPFRAGGGFGISWIPSNSRQKRWSCNTKAYHQSKSRLQWAPLEPASRTLCGGEPSIQEVA